MARRDSERRPDVREVGILFPDLHEPALGGVTYSLTFYMNQMVSQPEKDVLLQFHYSSACKRRTIRRVDPDRKFVHPMSIVVRSIHFAVSPPHLLRSHSAPPFPLLVSSMLPPTAALSVKPRGISSREARRRTGKPRPHHALSGGARSSKIRTTPSTSLVPSRKKSYDQTSP